MRYISIEEALFKSSSQEFYSVVASSVEEAHSHIGTGRTGCSRQSCRKKVEWEGDEDEPLDEWAEEQKDQSEDKDQDDYVGVEASKVLQG